MQTCEIFAYEINISSLLHTVEGRIYFYALDDKNVKSKKQNRPYFIMFSYIRCYTRPKVIVCNNIRMDVVTSRHNNRYLTTCN